MIARLQKSEPERVAAKGFTLLEMMLSVAVFAILATTAFALVGTTTELMAEISESQNLSTSESRFLETVRTAFEEMTPESSLEFDVFDRSAGAYDTYLSFVKTPRAFDFGRNLEDEIERVVLATELQPDGSIRSGIYYMTEETHALAAKKSFSDLDRVPFVELASGMRQMSWLFFDSGRKEWHPEPIKGDPSTLVALKIRMKGSKSSRRSVYWHVPS